ncbi:MAG: esterase/lipase family protein [Myxococcota bacterium]
MMPIALFAVAIATTTAGVAAGWVAIGYGAHWRATASGRPKLGKYLRAFGPEWISTIRTWVGYPSALTPVGPFAPFVPAGGPPIALIHGYMMNRSSMAWIGKQLRARGYGNVTSLEARPHAATMEVQADALAHDIRRWSEHAGGAKVIVVAHSQGGLLTRVALSKDPTLPISGVVTIGSPHAGTVMARVARTANAKQMRYGSEFLRDLPKAEVPFVSIYSDLDNIVFPKETSRFGRCVELPGIGHHALCFSPEVLSAVVEAFSDFRLS